MKRTATNNDSNNTPDTSNFAPAFGITDARAKEICGITAPYIESTADFPTIVKELEAQATSPKEFAFFMLIMGFFAGRETTEHELRPKLDEIQKQMKVLRADITKE